MGKKQHSKDRMYITKTEWSTEWGGAKSKDASTPYKKLPFHCCALTFTPFEYPVCTIDGSVFDVMNIVPYIKKYGKHPVTGAPLKPSDLISLTFHKNSEGVIIRTRATLRLIQVLDCIVYIRMSIQMWCLDSCEDLKKRAGHAIEYVEGDSKKPKTALPE